MIYTNKHRLRAATCRELMYWHMVPYEARTGADSKFIGFDQLVDAPPELDSVQSCGSELLSRARACMLYARAEPQMAAVWRDMTITLLRQVPWEAPGCTAIRPAVARAVVESLSSTDRVRYDARPRWTRSRGEGSVAMQEYIGLDKITHRDIRAAMTRLVDAARAAVLDTHDTFWADQPTGGAQHLTQVLDDVVYVRAWVPASASVTRWDIWNAVLQCLHRWNALPGESGTRVADPAQSLTSVNAQPFQPTRKEPTVEDTPVPTPVPTPGLGSPLVDTLTEALTEAEARLAVLVDQDRHKLLDVVARGKARLALQAARDVIDAAVRAAPAAPTLAPTPRLRQFEVTVVEPITDRRRRSDMHTFVVQAGSEDAALRVFKESPYAPLYGVIKGSEFAVTELPAGSVAHVINIRGGAL